MIAQGDPCHVTTISSGAGITVNPGFATYSMTKHAVLALTEALYLDLTAQGVGNIGVTIVMPGVIQSKIMFPEKTGPDALQDELKARLSNPALGALEGFMRQAVDAGLPADALAALVYGAIAKGDLYVLPNFTDEGSQAHGTGRRPRPCHAARCLPAHHADAIQPTQRTGIVKPRRPGSLLFATRITVPRFPDPAPVRLSGVAEPQCAGSATPTACWSRWSTAKVLDAGQFSTPSAGTRRP